ncbi:hypothetical protein [Streptomyces shenzhenensis]|uniref:hypothetical protein n=1 Tax=Streptomyces shenzhenensis TaxID=943815 RepID=UPI0015F0C54A|nr:hypothetical protein [Streptomyces shenzhenensis]
MWNLPDAVSQRFPLVARPRPACLPLPRRVHDLLEVAGDAAKLKDPIKASAVYNQAALIASDVGQQDTARAICHQHAAAYLHAAPLAGRTAIRALEPAVNLARIQIRAGQAAEGHQLLLMLFDAVSTESPAHVEDITVPASLTATAEDRHEVRAWLWSVLLADGTRALTSTGRWAEALTHVEMHRGVGRRMFDGRQVAVLAALTSGNTLSGRRLLADTAPGEPWEKAVTDSLTVLCRRLSGRPWRRILQDLVTAFLQHPDQDGMAVFNTRLGLALLDSIDSAEDPVARLVVAELHRRAMRTTDGYAAREALTHPLFAALATDQEAEECSGLLRDCALEAGTFPEELNDQLAAALRTSDRVIRRSLNTGAGSCR